FRLPRSDLYLCRYAPPPSLAPERRLRLRSRLPRPREAARRAYPALRGGGDDRRGARRAGLASGGDTDGLLPIPAGGRPSRRRLDGGARLVRVRRALLRYLRVRAARQCGAL